MQIGSANRVFGFRDLANGRRGRGLTSEKMEGAERPLRIEIGFVVARKTD